MLKLDFSKTKNIDVYFLSNFKTLSIRVSHCLFLLRKQKYQTNKKLFFFFSFNSMIKPFLVRKQKKINLEEEITIANLRRGSAFSIFIFLNIFSNALVGPVQF